MLTDVRTARGRIGVLRFDEPGRYLVEEPGRGVAVAEVSLDTGSRALALPAAEYRVTRRATDHLLVGTFEVKEGAARSVDLDTMSRVDFARVVRKGGTTVTAVGSAFALGGVRGSIQQGGPAWQTAIGLRYDLAELSLEARLGVGAAHALNDRIAIDTMELTIALAALRAFDLGPISLSLGLEVGGIRLVQRFDDELTANRTSYGLFGGPVALGEIPVDRFYFRVEAALPTYFLRTGQTADSAARRASITFHAGAGAGVHF